MPDLAGPQKTAAGDIPAGTAVGLDPGQPSDVLRHLPDVGMRANPGEFAKLAGVTVRALHHYAG